MADTEELLLIGAVALGAWYLLSGQQRVVGNSSFAPQGNTVQSGGAGVPRTGIVFDDSNNPYGGLANPNRAVADASNPGQFASDWLSGVVTGIGQLGKKRSLESATSVYSQVKDKHIGGPFDFAGDIGNQQVGLGMDGVTVSQLLKGVTVTDKATGQTYRAQSFVDPATQRVSIVRDHRPVR